MESTPFLNFCDGITSGPGIICGPTSFVVWVYSSSESQVKVITAGNLRKPELNGIAGPGKRQKWVLILKIVGDENILCEHHLRRSVGFYDYFAYAK